MTIVIANNSPRVSYTVAADATQTSFAVSFEFFADADLNFIVDGTTKTLTTHYTVSGGDGSTGTITTTTGNTVTGISGGSTVVITRDIALERTTDFPAQGSFQISSLNTELDRFTAIAADLNDKANRSLQLTDFDTAVSLTLPVVATRKGKVLAFNASTGVVEAGPSTSDVQTVSANAASVALLGTSDAVSDMNALSATAVLADMALLGTSAAVADMALLATSAVIADMDLLATSAVITDMGLLGTSANVTAMDVLGTSANVTAMSALSASAVVTDMALLGTSAVIADMALLATTDVIADMNTLATSAIVADLAILATTDIVADMAILATSDIISDMNALATSDIISDLNALATSDIISDMNTLSASAVISDMASLAGSGANPNITSVTASGTIAFGSLSDGTVTITDIADEDNMSSNSAVKLATQQSIKAYVDGQSSLSLIDEDNMASNSATRPPSQQSVKAYVDAVVPLVLIDEDGMGTNSATRPPSQQSTKAYVDGLTGDASTSAKGRASFSSDNFAASSGAITIKDGGVNLTAEVTGTLPIANGGIGATSLASANIVATNAQNTFTKAQLPSTYSGTALTLDFDTYQNFIITLSAGANTLAAPTTEASQVGQSGTIIFINPSSGNAATVSLHGDYENAGAAGITISAANNDYDVVPYIIKANNSVLLGASQLNFG